MHCVNRWLLLSALTLLLSACASLPAGDFDEPVVDVVGLQPVAGSGLEARFAISLRVVNPNSTPLEVKGIYYELDIEGNRLLSGASSEPVTVPGYGEEILRVEASTSMFGSFSLIRELMTNPPDDGLDYALNAKLSLQGLGRAIRVERSGKVGGPEA